MSACLESCKAERPDLFSGNKAAQSEAALRYTQERAAAILLANMDTFAQHNAKETEQCLPWADTVYGITTRNDLETMVDDARTAFEQGQLGTAMRLWRFLVQTIQTAHERRNDLDACLLRDLMAVEVSQRECRALVRSRVLHCHTTKTGPKFVEDSAPCEYPSCKLCQAASCHDHKNCQHMPTCMQLVHKCLLESLCAHCAVRTSRIAANAQVSTRHASENGRRVCVRVVSHLIDSVSALSEGAAM